MSNPVRPCAPPATHRAAHRPPCAATASIAGATAGLLGLTNLSGFAFYLLSSLLVGAIYAAGNCKARPARYFAKASDVLVGGMLDNLFAFVLFWTRELSVG